MYHSPFDGHLGCFHSFAIMVLQETYLLGVYNMSAQYILIVKVLSQWVSRFKIATLPSDPPCMEAN